MITRLDVLNIDEDLTNSDWTKRTWDLPPYKSNEFMTYLQSVGTSLDQFKELPVYKNAVARGLIRNDEWVGETQ